MVTSAKSLWPPYEIDETRDATGRLVIVPSLTASLDAALAFCEGMVTKSAWVMAKGLDVDEADDGPLYCFHILRGIRVDSGPLVEAESATLPVAICLCVVKAMIALHTEQGTSP